MLSPLLGALCSWCCGVGSAAACPLFRGSGRALVPLLLHDGPCIHPSSDPLAALLLLPWPPPRSGTTSSPAASFTAMTPGTCFCSLHDLFHPHLDPGISPAQGPGWGGAVLGMMLPLCPGLNHGLAWLSCGMGEAGSLPSPGRVCLYLAASSPLPLCPMTCPNAGRVPSGAAPYGPFLSYC